MPRRKKIDLTYEREKIRQNKLMEYMMSLLDRLAESASMLSVHILDEFVAQSGSKSLEEVIEALETIVPMRPDEYKWSLTILYKLIHRLGGDLAPDIILAFEEEVQAKYDVKSVLEVGAIDRREVIRKLCDIYRGLVRFRMLTKTEKETDKERRGTMA